MTKLIYRRKLIGLAILLAGIVFAFSVGAERSHACDGAPAENDSTILERHIRETKVHYALEEFSDHSFNSHLNEDEMDSILAASGIRFYGAQIIYSPDSAFKIFVVEGEECIRSCEDLSESFLHYNDGSGFVNNRVMFSHIRQIAVMKDGKYLVINEEFANKTNTGQSTILSAALISFSGYAISYHPIQIDPVMTDSTSPRWFFMCAQESSYDNEVDLSFDATTQQLKYSYVNNAGGGEDEAYLYEGSLLYQDGRFQQGPEMKRIFITK